METENGVELHHDKDEQVAGCWAVFIVIVPPLMRELLKRRVSEPRKKLEDLPVKPLGKQTLEKRQEGIEKAQRALKRVSSCSLGDTTAPFNADGVCFKAKTDEHGEETNCKGLRDLFKYGGERCRGLSNWSPHVARSEHATLFVKDCVSKCIPKTDRRVDNFASRTRFSKMVMFQAYDFQKAKRAPGDETHSSMLRSARTLATTATPAPVQPETTQGVL